MYGVGDVPPSFRDGGLFYTDGSGGSFGSIPSLRRCGVGVAPITTDITCDWGVYCGLPGPVQSVLRSGLFAVLFVITHADPDLAITICTDSRLTAVHYHLRADENWAKHEGMEFHLDLWLALQRVRRLRRAPTTVLWVKAHAAENPAFIWSYNLPRADVIGNSCADWLAGQGAETWP